MLPKLTSATTVVGIPFAENEVANAPDSLVPHKASSPRQVLPKVLEEASRKFASAATLFYSVLTERRAAGEMNDSRSCTAV